MAAQPIANDFSTAPGSRGLLHESLGRALNLAAPDRGSSPLIPRPILRWTGRGGRPVLDALLIPMGKGTSALAPKDREALAGFAVRAARTTAELEVWGGTPSLWEPDEGARTASEIAQLAIWLGRLPPTRARVVTPLWPLAPGTGVTILLVSPAKASP